MNKNTTGFTIIELLIVIVVIAILAALSIVTYTNIQQRARDTQRKNDLAQIAKALHLYNVEYDTFSPPGSGDGTGNGWFHTRYVANRPTISEALVAAEVMSQELADPLSSPDRCGVNTICRAYVKATCSMGTYLYASLESEPAGHDGPTNNTCRSTWDTEFGMNYVVKIN